MKSSTESGYGARIGNAESLLRALQGFNGYQSSRPELTPAGLSAAITAIKSQNDQIAIARQNYTHAVGARVNIFEKEPYSVSRILSPINATVKVSFGKEAKETKNIAGIIAKIRGTNAKTIKNTDGTFVSQSHQSYNSKIQFFADLIANLSNFGEDYVPAKNELTVDHLKQLYQDAVNANNLVIEKYSQFIQKNDIRLEAYEQISKNSFLIKENVKAQYGYNSSEYNIVKKLKI